MLSALELGSPGYSEEAMRCQSRSTKSLWSQLTDSNLCPISEHTGSLCAPSFCLCVPHPRALIRTSGNQKTEGMVTEREREGKKNTNRKEELENERQYQRGIEFRYFQQCKKESINRPGLFLSSLYWPRDQGNKESITSSE